jgi:hypothetical protein
MMLIHTVPTAPHWGTISTSYSNSVISTHLLPRSRHALQDILQRHPTVATVRLYHRGGPGRNHFRAPPPTFSQYQAEVRTAASRLGRLPVR